MYYCLLSPKDIIVYSLQKQDARNFIDVVFRVSRFSNILFKCFLYKFSILGIYAWNLHRDVNKWLIRGVPDLDFQIRPSFA